MRTLKLLALLLLFAGPVLAQVGPENEETAFVLNRAGDAAVTTRSEFSAAAWRLYKEQVGTSTDLIKRDFVRGYPMFSVENFQISMDDANRVFVRHYTFRPYAEYDGQGRFKVRVPGAWKLVSNTATEWAFAMQDPNQSTPPSIKISLPAGARSARLSETSNGRRYIYYTLATGAGSGPAWILAGVGLIGLLVTGGLAISAGRAPRTPSEQGSRTREAKAAETRTNHSRVGGGRGREGLGGGRS